MLDHQFTQFYNLLPVPHLVKVYPLGLVAEVYPHIVSIHGRNINGLPKHIPDFDHRHPDIRPDADQPIAWVGEYFFVLAE